MTTTGGHSTLFEAVKACDLRSVLESLGYAFQAGRDGFLVENPLREERTSSIRVRTDNPSKWHDFGTGEGGDLIDFLQAAEGLDVEAARARAAELLNVPYTPGGNGLERVRLGGKEIDPPPPFDPLPPRFGGNITTAKSEPEAPQDYHAVAKQAHAALFSASLEARKALAYLKARGITEATIRTALLGVIDASVELPASMKRHTFQGRITFPYRNREGRTVFLNARAAADVEPSERFRKPSGASQSLPYAPQPLDPATEAVIVVEGEMDALSVLQAAPGAAVVATGGGKGLSEGLARALPADLAVGLLLLDADEAGKGFAEGARKALEARGAQAATLTLPEGCKDPNDALLRLGEDLFSDHLEPQLAANHPRAGLSDLLYLETLFLEELDRRHARPHAAYATGLGEIDHLLDGGYHEGLHVLGGITGGGKTSFAVRVALQNALEGRHVIYATYEQSKLELWARLAAAVTHAVPGAGLPYRALKRGTYHEADGSHLPVANLLQRHAAWNTLRRASERIVVLEAGDAFSRRDSVHTLESLRTLALRLREENDMPPLVIVDYLQRVPAVDLAGRDIRERVAYVAGLLQVGLAREVGCPVLALSSLNRASYHQSRELSPEQRLSSLKESGDLEYSAYTVSLLYGIPEGKEPQGYVPETFDTWKPVMFDVVKNREGPIGERPLRWTPVGDSWTDTPGGW